MVWSIVSGLVTVPVAMWVSYELAYSKNINEGISIKNTNTPT